eukprot:3933768-Amphidinium_carterae.1
MPAICTLGTQSCRLALSLHMATKMCSKLTEVCRCSTMQMEMGKMQTTCSFKVSSMLFQSI